MFQCCQVALGSSVCSLCPFLSCHEVTHPHTFSAMTIIKCDEMTYSQSIRQNHLFLTLNYLCQVYDHRIKKKAI